MAGLSVPANSRLDVKRDSQYGRFDATVDVLGQDEAGSRSGRSTLRLRLGSRGAWHTSPADCLRVEIPADGPMEDIHVQLGYGMPRQDHSAPRRSRPGSRKYGRAWPSKWRDEGRRFSINLSPSLCHMTLARAAVAACHAVLGPGRQLVPSCSGR